MKWLPRKAQLEAMTFLVKQSCGGLLLSMGMGKTSISLGAILALRAKGFVKRVLIVAPIRTLYTVWPEEVKKWDEFRHLRTVNLHANPGAEQSDKTADIYLINPERFVKWTGNPYRLTYDLLIIDESSLWKAHDSKRFKALRAVLGSFPRRWILTGTPSPNSYMDLWAQAYIIDAGRALGRFITHFRNAFCVPDRDGYNYTVTAESKREIEDRLAPLVFRRDLKDLGLEMPERIDNPIRLLLPPEAMQRYREMELLFFTRIKEEGIDSPNAATAGMRCRQIASGAIYNEGGKTVDVHDAKTAAVEELVDALNGEPLLLFYEFKHEYERIAKLRPGTPNLSGMGGHEAQLTVEAFNRGEIPLLMAHPASAGFGLNLQARCSHVAFFTPTWNLAQFEQGIARVWRVGQASTVFVHHFIAENTLDEKVVEVVAAKGASQNGLLNKLKELADDYCKMDSPPIS